MNKNERVILRFLIAAVSVYVAGIILPGVHIANLWIAMVVSAFIGLFNAFLRPILILLTIPVTLLTLGLFLVVINGFIVYLSQLIVPGFDISSFLMAVLFSLLLSFFILVGERIFGLRNQS